MIGKCLVVNLMRSKNILLKLQNSSILRRNFHSDGPTRPFENMPFSIPNRYAATLFFTFFLGIGLWAPYFILWYSMAKRTL